MCVSHHSSEIPHKASRVSRHLSVNPGALCVREVDKRLSIMNPPRFNYQVIAAAAASSASHMTLRDLFSDPPVELMVRSVSWGEARLRRVNKQCLTRVVVLYVVSITCDVNIPRCVQWDGPEEGHVDAARCEQRMRGLMANEDKGGCEGRGDCEKGEADEGGIRRGRLT